MGVCPTSPHVLCGSGEGIHRVPRGILWGVLRDEYGVREPLLRAVRSLYDRSRSLVRIAGRFLGVCQGPEGVRFGNHRISSLLFADDVVHMASSGQDLQHVLEAVCSAKCEAAGMRISTSKSEAMVLDRKRVACPLQVGGEVLPQVEEFKYLRVLFTSEGKIEREIDRRILVQRPHELCGRLCTGHVVVKGARKLIESSRLPVNLVPTLTYGHELWGGVPGGISHREEASGKTQDTLEDYVSRLAWERLGVPPEELEEVSG
ncbi:hypothetical protein L3Q82_025286, partial [Scortum barcoo]